MRTDLEQWSEPRGLIEAYALEVALRDPDLPIATGPVTGAGRPRLEPVGRGAGDNSDEVGLRRALLAGTAMDRDDGFGVL